MGYVWPQITQNGKQPGWFQANNPERSMVATRKPWDAPGLKLLQKYELLTKIYLYKGSERSNFVSRMCLNVYVKSINPERSMVAARKPWDVPGLKQHLMGNNPEG